MQFRFRICAVRDTGQDWNRITPDSLFNIFTPGLCKGFRLTVLNGIMNRFSSLTDTALL